MLNVDTLEDFQNGVEWLPDDATARVDLPIQPMLEVIGAALMNLGDDDDKSRAIDSLILAGSSIQPERRGAWCLKVLDLMNAFVRDTPAETEVGSAVGRADTPKVPKSRSLSPLQPMEEVLFSAADYVAVGRPGSRPTSRAESEDDGGWINTANLAQKLHPSSRPPSVYEPSDAAPDPYASKSIALRTVASGSDGASLAKLYSGLFAEEAKRSPLMPMEPIGSDSALQQLAALREVAQTVDDDDPAVAGAIRLLARGYIEEADARMSGTDGLGLAEQVDVMLPHDLAGLLLHISALAETSTDIAAAVTGLCQMAPRMAASSHRETLYGLMLDSVLRQPTQVTACDILFNRLGQSLTGARGLAIDRFRITEGFADKILQADLLEAAQQAGAQVDPLFERTDPRWQAEVTARVEASALLPKTAVAAVPLSIARRAAPDARKRLEAAVWASVTEKPALAQGRLDDATRQQFVDLAKRMMIADPAGSSPVVRALIYGGPCAEALIAAIQHQPDPIAFMLPVLMSDEFGVDALVRDLTRAAVREWDTSVCVELIKRSVDHFESLKGDKVDKARSLIPVLFDRDPDPDPATLKPSKAALLTMNTSLAYLMGKKKALQIPAKFSPYLDLVTEVRYQTAVLNEKRAVELLWAIYDPSLALHDPTLARR